MGDTAKGPEEQLIADVQDSAQDMIKVPVINSLFHVLLLSRQVYALARLQLDTELNKREANPLAIEVLLATVQKEAEKGTVDIEQARKDALEILMPFLDYLEVGESSCLQAPPRGKKRKTPDE